MTSFKRALIRFAATAGLAMSLGTASALALNVYTDAGIPAGAGVSVGGGAGPVLDLNYTGDPAEPEGTKSGRMVVSSQWAFWDVHFAARDLSAYNGGKLVFWLKSTETLEVIVQSNLGGAFVQVPNTSNNWVEQEIDLSSFAGINLAGITVPFQIRRVGSPGTATTWLVDNVRWEMSGATPVLRPGSTRVNPGGRRQFFIENASDPALSDTPASLGELSVASGNEVIFTAGPTAQNGTVNATKNGFTGVAAVEVTNDDLTQELGLLSETIPGPVGTTADVFPYAGPSSSVNLTNVESDFREGTFSVRSDMTVAVGGWAGWAIETPAGTTDLNEYFDGSLRFWFKANAELANKMSISVRSNNVGAGAEQKIWLHNLGVTFNDTWQTVTIPVDTLAGSAPKADLTQVKVLFNIAVASVTTGGQFFIDNLRWDSRTPGALDRIEVTPGPSLALPKGLKRNFTAVGYDASNVPVDIWPTWSLSGGMGSVSPSVGPVVLYTAATSPNAGTITASFGGENGVTNITIQDIEFTQSVNVYTDLGAGGQIFVFNGPGDSLLLSGPEHVPGDAPEGIKVMRATYTLTATGWAGWFVTELNGTRFLEHYAGGYLNFHVRTTRDLEIAMRSNNIPAGQTNAKVLLSDIGVPTDGTWQEVWLALDQFKQLDNRLDFSQMKDLFIVAAVGPLGGAASNQVFDIDGVRWYTADDHIADPDKVYLGIQNKQGGSGLVLTFDNDVDKRAVTYDQALAAMAFTYRTETARAEDVLDVYLGKFGNGSGFAGFHEEYDRDAPATIRDFDRTAGPNAFILLAALHHKSATGSTAYDDMIAGLANWLLSLQAPDGAIKLGFLGNPGTAMNNKSTEHNFDAYAAFKAYATVVTDPVEKAKFAQAADDVYAWLTTSHLSGGAWNAAEQRFNVGRHGDNTPNIDHALDAYSWAPLALSGYESVLDLAETNFLNTKTVDVSGFSMSGFDFSGYPGETPGGDPGDLPDKDAVWIEGTAHMVVAYLVAGRQDKATEYLNELNKAVYNTAGGAQGLTYASNAGTAYWYPSLMDSTHASLSSMSWYLFANWGFNPFQPVPLFDIQVKNISNNNSASNVTWSATVPTRWVRANQYIEFRVNPVDQRPWGLQIYTDNTNPAMVTRFEDPTPGNPNNADSDPAGLIRSLQGETTSHHKLVMGWRVQDAAAPAPAAVRPFNEEEGDGGNPEANNWLYFKDLNSPPIDIDQNGQVGDPVDLTGFIPGESYVTVKDNSGIQITPILRAPALSPDHIFLEADFGPAAAQVSYRTNIVLELYFQ